MSDQQTSSGQKAPWHLWVFGILALLWSGMGARDYLMTQTKNEAYMSKFTPEQLEFFYGFPAWLTAFWAVAVWGGVLGCILLLLRRRVAAGVLSASFLAMIVTVIQNYFFDNGLEVMGGASALIFSCVIFLISLGLVLYSCALRRRGILV